MGAVAVDERAAALLRLHDLVLDRQDGDHRPDLWESGKARKHAFDEPLHVALTARYYARTAHEHLDTRRAARRRARPDPGRGQPGAQGRRRHHLAVELPLHDGALRRPPGPARRQRGGRQARRPDDAVRAPRYAELLEEAGFPRDLWQVVAGPGSRRRHRDHRARRLRLLHRLDRDRPAGRQAVRRAADRLLARARRQEPACWCCATPTSRRPPRAPSARRSPTPASCASRWSGMFVADQVYDRFVERFVARTEAMTLGATLEWGNDMGSLISQDAARHRRRARRGRRRQGRRVLTGGRARPDLGPFFFEPTILEGVTPDMTCFGHETFGPVISLYRFHDEAEAVARANDGEYGLNASIYSQDGTRARAMAARSSAGRSTSTRPSGRRSAASTSPMGGMRQSGHGPAAGQRGHPPLHRVAVGRDPAADPVRADAGDVRRALRQGDDRQPAADEGKAAGTPGAGDAPIDYDVLVVGSGFGGSVTALRLTEKGYRVGVLEAGARFDDDDFPATSCDVKRYLFAPALGCYGIQRIDARQGLPDPGRRRRRRRLAGLRQHPLRAARPVLRRPAWAHITDWQGRARAVLRPGQADARRGREPRA